MPICDTQMPYIQRALNDLEVTCKVEFLTDQTTAAKFNR